LFISSHESAFFEKWIICNAMDEVGKKRSNLLKVLLFAVLGVLFALPCSAAAPPKNMHENAKSNVAFLQKQGETDSRISIQHGLIAAKQNLSGGFNWADARDACERMEISGYNDWHLPSRDELNKLYLARTLIGGFSDERYWSSTESDQHSALSQQFLDGSEDVISKMERLLVRPIRTF
jgi:hypothetical protein